MRFRKIVLALTCALVAATFAHAQSAPAPTLPTNAAQARAAETAQAQAMAHPKQQFAKQTSPTTPQLTATEKTALTALAQQSQEVAKAQQQLQQQVREVLSDVEKQHPGYRFNPANGQLETLPPPGKPAKK